VSNVISGFSCLVICFISTSPVTGIMQTKTIEVAMMVTSQQ